MATHCRRLLSVRAALFSRASRYGPGVSIRRSAERTRDGR